MSNPEYQPERRPLATRERNFSKVLANRLAASGITPNAISVAGMVAGIAAGVAFAVTGFGDSYRWCFFLAAVLIQMRLLANMLDGMVAIQTESSSPVGELYNEIPDRVSDGCTIIGAGYAGGGSAELGFIAAALAIFIAYVRAQGKVAGAHQEFCGPMAKPQRMFLLTVLALVCAFAPTSWLDFGTPLPGWGLIAWGLGAIILGELVTVARRLLKISAALKEQG